MSYRTRERSKVTAILLFTALTMSEGIAQSDKPAAKPKTEAGTTSLPASKNCGCDYFPMCDYTATIKFGNVTYYGLEGSEKKETYYRCSNGIITMKWFTYNEVLAERRWEWRNDINDYGYVDYYEDERVINTREILKLGLPVGSGWTDTLREGGFIKYYTIEAKDLKMVEKGKQYNDVLKLTKVTKSKMSKQDYVNQQDTYGVNSGQYIFQNTFYYNGEVFKESTVYYFDKYTGLIREENTWDELKSRYSGRIDGIKSPSQVEADKVKQQSMQSERERVAAEETQKKKEIAGQQEKVFLASKMQGKVDATMEGTWRYFNRSIETYLIYKFNPDGSFQYYVANMRPENLKKNGKWLINGDSLCIYYEVYEKPYLEKYHISKINNSQTGNPSLLINHGAGPGEYENISKKSAWTNLPAYGEGNKPQVKEEQKLEGVIDNELIGTWIYKSASGIYLTTYTFNKDGSGSYIDTKNGKTKQNITFEWKYKDEFLHYSVACGEDQKCFRRTKLQKMKSSGKMYLLEAGTFEFYKK